ncbi:MAG: helix-turn-helix domain-containing protein [Planctomycetota bacterium]
MNNRKPNTKIKSALLELGWTQRDLSKKTQIRQEYISMCIHGKFILNDMQRVKVAAALGKKVEEVF